MRKFYLLLLLIFVIGCQKANLEQEQAPSIEVTTQTKVPYADDYCLHEYDEDNSIVKYTFARKLAIVDIAVNKIYETYNWANCKL